MKIIRDTKNKWNKMRPDSQVVVVLGVLYVIIFIAILTLGLYVKIWN